MYVFVMWTATFLCLHVLHCICACNNSILLLTFILTALSSCISALLINEFWYIAYLEHDYSWKLAMLAKAAYSLLLLQSINGDYPQHYKPIY